MNIASLAIELLIHIPRSLVFQTRIMARRPTSLRVTDVLLLICVLITLWRVVSSRGWSSPIQPSNSMDYFNGGRKALEQTPSRTEKEDFDRMLSTPSSVCRIVHQKGSTTYCFGALVSSRWLLTAARCAPHDMSPSNHHIRVICGHTSRSPAPSQNEFHVLEVKTLRSATTGQKQEPDFALLKLDADVSEPYVKFEETDGPDFYILEQSELMRTFFNVSDLKMEQTLDSWHKSNIDLIGLPLIANSSALNNEDASENALQQITTCCLATACQLFKDGLGRCTFSRLTPREYKSICRITGTCNEVHSAFGMTPSFHRSLSSSPTNDTCTGSPKIVMIRNCRPIPPFLQPCCSDETLTQLKDIKDKRKTFKDMVKQNNASLLEEWILCSEFNVSSMDSNKDTLLHNAAFKDANDTAKVLCELNIDTELKNANGNTPVITAAQRSNLKVLKVILKSCKNVNVNATDSTHKTALHYAAAKNSSAMAQVLCNTSIDTEIKTNGGRTALLAAAYQSRLEVLKVIVISCKNVNVSATDSTHKTSLHYAAARNSRGIAQMLCKAGINLEMKNANGKTALIIAANRTSYETLKVIVNCGANVNATDNNSRTALHHAAMNCGYDEAKFLMKHHANCTIVDSGNHIAKDLIPMSPETCGNETARNLSSLFINCK